MTKGSFLLVCREAGVSKWNNCSFSYTERDGHFQQLVFISCIWFLAASNNFLLLHFPSLMVTWMKNTHCSKNSRDQYSSSYRCKGQNKAEFSNDKIFAIAGLVHYPQKQSGWDIPLSTTGTHFYASVALL